MPKKKSSKKKLAEQKRREEEERERLHNEEIQRIELDRKRISENEALRVRLLEEARLAKEERLRIGEEEKEFNDNLTEYDLIYEARLSALKENQEWQSFLQCSELPNPDDESEINSYLTLWRDNPNRMSDSRDVEEDFKVCVQGMELYRRLEAAMFREESNGNDKQAQTHRKNMNKISEAIIATLDDVTAYVMQFSDVYIDKVEDQFTKQTTDLIYGLWINIAQNARKKYVHFKDIHASSELALKGMALQKIAIRMVQLGYDPLSILSRQSGPLSVVGGINYVDILKIPPQPKTFKSWTIRKVTSLSHKVQREEYQQVDHSGQDITPETKVSFRVSKNVLIRSEIPSVAWWDSNAKVWSLDGIDQDKTTYDPETRKLTFYTKHMVTALAVVSERVFDVPYESWSIKPLLNLGRNVALFQLKPAPHSNSLASIDDIVILIHNDSCKLLSPILPELSHISNNWHEPKVLLRRLAEAGINLLLKDEDAQYCDRTPKAGSLEEKAYREMGWAINMVGFRSSRWNHDLNVGNMCSVFQVTKEIKNPSNYKLCEETLDRITLSDVQENYSRGWADPHDKDQWETAAYYNFKATYLDCSETSEKVVLTPPPGEKTHLNLTLAIAEHKSVDSVEWVKSTDFLLGETVRVLFSAIRPLSW